MPDDDAAETADPRDRPPSPSNPLRGLAASLLLLLAIGVLPALAATSWAVEHMRELALRDAFAKADVMAAGTAERLRWLMQDAEATMAAVAQRRDVRALDAAACEPLQRDFSGGSLSSLMAMTLRRLDGSAVCLPSPATPEVAAEPWFKAAVQQDGFHATGVHVLYAGQPWTARLTHPVLDAQGRRHGLLVLPVDLMQLRQRLFERVPAGATAVVLDGEHRVLTRSALHDQRVGKAAAPAVAQVLQDLQAQRRGAPAADRLQSLARSFTDTGIDGSRSLFVVRTVPLSDWAVVGAVPEAETLQAYQAWLQRSAIGTLGVLLLGALAAAWVGRSILDPVKALAAAARSLATGGAQRAGGAAVPVPQVPVSGPRELRELAQDFNRMARLTARSAEQLRASETRWRALIEQLPVAVLAYAADGTLELANPCARGLLAGTGDASHGWQFADAAGQPLPAAAHPLQQALRSGKPVAAQPLAIVQQHAPAQVAAWVLVTAHPIFESAEPAASGGRSDAGEAAEAGNAPSAAMHARPPQRLPHRVLLAMVDVTAQRVAEQDRVAKEVAEAASRAKTAFLSRVSHELRTPLNAINGFSELLLNDPGLPGDAKLKIERVLNAGRHLLSLVEQILDLTRVESGALPPRLQPVPLWPLLQDCLAVCEPLAHARHVSLQLQAPPAAADRRSLQVRGDEARLRQVLMNLLTNGIKYNRAGGQVRVNVQRLDAGAPGAPAVAVNVCDTGVGMDAERIAGLFQPFERLGAEHRGIEGHGLGLVISRVLAQSMGGEIHVHSLVGEGSCFALHLQAVDLPAPASPSAAPAERLGEPGDAADSQPALARHAGDREARPAHEPAVRAPGRRPRVLCIEDNAMNLALMREVFSLRQDLDFSGAEDGLAGVQAVHELRPDLVLVDIGLPVLDGFAVLDRIRRNPATAATPCWAVTADPTPATAERARHAGFERLLTKPVSVAALLEALAAWLPPGPQPGVEAAR